MFCQNCGTQNLESAKFCKSCGEKFLYIQPKIEQKIPIVVSPIKKPKQKWNWLIIGVIVFVALITVLLFLLALYKEKTYIPAQVSFKKIVTNYDSIFGIGEDDSLWAWGQNDSGQLGDGTTTNIKIPKQIIASGVLDMSGNFAIKADGSLWAWGDNTYGQLGDGTTINSPIPKQIIASGIKEVASGSNSAFAIKADGSLWAWGSNLYGQLGEGIEKYSYTPKQVMKGDVIKIEVDFLNVFAIKADGSLWAWGQDYSEVIGDGYDHKLKQIMVNGVKKVVSSNNSVFVLKTDGSIWTWGDNAHGQLGDGALIYRKIPKQIIESGVRDIVASGGDNVFALKTDNSLWAWGDNTHGQLGDGSMINSPIPKQIMADNVRDIVSGSGYHTIVLKIDGSIWTWGVNSSGQLGDGTKTNSSVPRQIIAGEIKEASSGDQNTFILKTDGSLWAWGWNGGGSLWPWGWDGHGSLGDGTTINRTAPKQITSGGGLNQASVTPEQTTTDNNSNQILTTPVENVVTTDFACGTSQVKDADGDTYGTVQIGDQCWMASNMKIGKKIEGTKSQSDNKKIERWCYNNDSDICKSDGGLYSWEEAMQYSTTEGAQGICPDGWHIPTGAEQKILQNHFMDKGINLVFAGFCFDGKFQGRGNSMNFWSSMETNSEKAKDMLVYSDKTEFPDDASIKKNGFSVRCIKNN